MEDRFGAPWQDVATVVAVTVAMYATAVVTVRLAGRRTVAELSAFDAVVTIALGSIIAATVVQPSVSYAHGATAFMTLLALQVGLAFARSRVRVLRRLVEFSPELVLSDDGVELPKAPWSSQLTEDELWSLLRQQGVFHRDEVLVAVLEPTGKLSVLRPGRSVDHSVVPDG